MSNQNAFGSRGRQLYPTLPHGEVVMTYETYQEAQKAVDVLARADFPVDGISIVGSDLKSVERVTGKLSWGRVAVAGAASGAWLGMFFGLLLVIFSPSTSLAFVLAAILIGAGFGMLFGLASYGINRRRRDFTSVMQVIATSYSVIADRELGNRARNLLQQSGSGEPQTGGHPSDPPAERSSPEHPRSEADTPPGSGGSVPAAAASGGETSAAEPRPAAARPRYGENLPEGEQAGEDASDDGASDDGAHPDGSR